MYDFYYNHLKNIYGDKCELLYTDTDSLLLEIFTNDVYSDMKQNSMYYDTSDYPQVHELYSEENKKVLGKMKDECCGRLITEYVGLRPKMYSILEDSEKNIRKAKGVKRNVVQQELKHEMYLDCLQEQTQCKHEMHCLRSEKHRVYGMQTNKVSLAPYDSKRWIADDGIKTLAYGHYLVRV